MGNWQVQQCRDKHGDAPKEAAKEMLPPITIRVLRLGGSATSMEISPSETVARLKMIIAPQLGVSKNQVKLVYGTTQLEDRKSLEEHGLLVADAEVNAIISPPVPAFAETKGLTCEHPAFLRDYYAKHQLQLPNEWENDDAVWKALEIALNEVAQSKERLQGWNHDITIYEDDEPTSVMRATPGEKVSVKVRGSIWNNRGDSCIHQLLLVLDKNIVAELSDGVPGRGRRLDRSLSFDAPSDPGIYMLWKEGALQYSMRDARRNVEQGIGGRITPNKYPKAFVSWVIVE